MNNIYPNNIMNKVYIIIAIICIVIFISNYHENFDNTVPQENTNILLNTEAIQNIASIYNKEKMTVTNLEVTGTFNLLPKGMICMWSGVTVPFGWAICDGTNKTPDLRSRFIIGANISDSSNNLTNYKIGDKGGNEQITLTAEQIPPHTHPLPAANGCFKNGGCDGRYSLQQQFDKPSEFDGHVITSKQSYTNVPVTILPPYYALAYIIKL